MPFVFPLALLSYQLFYSDSNGEANYASSSWALRAQRGVRKKPWSPQQKHPPTSKTTPRWDRNWLWLTWEKFKCRRASLFHRTPKFLTRDGALCTNEGWRRFPIFSPLRKATESKAPKASLPAFKAYVSIHPNLLELKGLGAGGDGPAVAGTHRDAFHSTARHCFSPSRFRESMCIRFTHVEDLLKPREGPKNSQSTCLFLMPDTHWNGMSIFKEPPILERSRPINAACYDEWTNLLKNQRERPTKNVRFF